MLKSLQIKTYCIIFARFFNNLLQRKWLAHGSLKPKDRVRISGGVLKLNGMEDRRTREIKERYLKRISKEVLETVQFIDSLADDEIRNKQWFIDWQDHLNEISVK